AAADGDETAAAGATGELDRGLDGLRSAVGEEDAGALRGLRHAQQRLRRLDLRRGGEEVAHVDQLRGLLRDRGDEVGVAVAERVDRDAAEQVQVAVPVGVPHPGTVPVGEDESRKAEDAEVTLAVAPQQRLLLLRDGVGHDGLPSRTSCWSSSSSGRIIVPNPSEVKISSSMEWGWRPSTTWAWGTPFVTALMQDSSFGIMPVATFSSSSLAPEALRWESSESRSGQSA